MPAIVPTIISVLLIATTRFGDPLAYRPRAHSSFHSSECSHVTNENLILHAEVLTYADEYGVPGNGSLVRVFHQTVGSCAVYLKALNEDNTVVTTENPSEASVFTLRAESESDDLCEARFQLEYHRPPTSSVNETLEGNSGSVNGSGSASESSSEEVSPQEEEIETLLRLKAKRIHFLNKCDFNLIVSAKPNNNYSQGYFVTATVLPPAQQDLSQYHR